MAARANHQPALRQKVSRPPAQTRWAWQQLPSATGTKSLQFRPKNGLAEFSHFGFQLGQRYNQRTPPGTTSLNPHPIMKQSSISRRHQSLLAGACLTAVLVTDVTAQGLLNIGFEGPPVQPPGTSTYVQSYFEAGMWFTPIGGVSPENGFGRDGGGFVSAPDNGTSFLATTLGDSLSFGFTDESLFDLVAVDLAEYSTVLSDPATVQFIGYFADGSTILQGFTTDGVIDGTGPLADFQTFYFSAGWVGLTRVEVPGFGWSLDNLVVRHPSGIPEPATPGLWLLGASALWGFRPSRPRPPGAS